MTNAHQPEAMRLADWLELHAIDGIERKAAAELRRLIEVEKQHNKLRDQRNELLEALTKLVEDLEMRSNWKRGDDKGVVDCGHSVYLKARAAIAKAGGAA